MTQSQLVLEPKTLMTIADQQYPWRYYSQLINPQLAEPLYQEVINLCQIRKRYINGQFRESKRISCFLTDSQNKQSNNYYGNLTAFDLSVSPIVQQIRQQVENYLNQRFHYCLVHIYPQGSAMINWHADREALNPNTSVVSVSLGATRKFRFRLVGQTSGWIKEYHLQSGDMIWMLPGCQALFEHTVPVESRVKNWRINLTFRQYFSEKITSTK